MGVVVAHRRKLGVGDPCIHGDGHRVAGRPVQAGEPVGALGPVLVAPFGSFERGVLLLFPVGQDTDTGVVEPAQLVHAENLRIRQRVDGGAVPTDVGYPTGHEVIGGESGAGEIQDELAGLGHH